MGVYFKFLKRKKVFFVDLFFFPPNWTDTGTRCSNPQHPVRRSATKSSALQQVTTETENVVASRRWYTPHPAVGRRSLCARNCGGQTQICYGQCQGEAPLAVLGTAQQRIQLGLIELEPESVYQLSLSRPALPFVWTMGALIFKQKGSSFTTHSISSTISFQMCLFNILSDHRKR